MRDLSLSVSLTLLVLAISLVAADTDLGLPQSPLKNDLAFQFFTLGADYATYSNITGRATYDDDQCDQDVQTIKEAILRYEEWALEFPDTWGRLPMGLFWGHTISMGAYQECLAASSVKPNTDIIRGKYCLTSLPIKGFMDKVVSRADSANLARISYKLETPTAFELGICVPSSCSAEKANEILKYVIKTFYGYSYKDETQMVSENYCNIDEPVKLRPIDIFAICFFAFIIFCLFASSIYDYVQTQNGSPKKPLFLAFSVLTNAPKIFTVKRTNNPNVIPCLNGLRCISMMWVVFGHGYMTFYELPHINRNEVYRWIETPFSMLVQNATFCVDTFFFMSGLLMLWGAFREMERTNGKLNIVMMYVHRYIRLTPVVAVVVLYIMSLYKYSGAGPMWMKLGTQDQRCSDTWWATLLYVQNYVFPYKICISQSWYLAVDTQLYVLSPLFLIPLWKWGKKAVGPIVIFGVLCMGCTFATFMHNRFTLFRAQDDQVSLRQALTYYPTHTRFPSWIAGVVFGYFFYKNNRGRQIPLATPWVLLGWFLALGIMLTDIWGPYWRILPENPNSPIVEGALYEPLSRFAWTMSIAWIVWACYNGHGGIINDFLSWDFFTGFSRLTYCMYVLHRIVQLTTAARLQTNTHFSDYDAILRWWHDFGFALTLSIFATLAFEAPILGIEAAIFGRGVSKPAPKKVETPTSASLEPNGTETAETEAPSKA